MMAGKLAKNDAISDAITAYRSSRIQVHSTILDVIILDVITDSMNQCFLAGKILCTGFACLDHRNFSNISQDSLTDIGRIKYALNQI